MYNKVKNDLSTENWPTNNNNNNLYIFILLLFISLKIKIFIYRPFTRGESY